MAAGGGARVEVLIRPRKKHRTLLPLSPPLPLPAPHISLKLTSHSHTHLLKMFRAFSYLFVLFVAAQMALMAHADMRVVKRQGPNTVSIAHTFSFCLFAHSSHVSQIAQDYPSLMTAAHNSTVHVSILAGVTSHVRSADHLHLHLRSFASPRLWHRASSATSPCSLPPDCQLATWLPISTSWWVYAGKSLVVTALRLLLTSGRHGNVPDRHSSDVPHLASSHRKACWTGCLHSLRRRCW